MTTGKTFKIVLIAALAVVFTAPMLMMLAGKINTETIDNRRLTPLPYFSVKRIVDAKFYAQVKDYLVDRFPYRPQIIRLRGDVLQNQLRDFNNDRIVWGKDEWMFIRDELRFSCDKPDMPAKAVRGMLLFTEYLKSLGKEVVFTIAPNKATIVPEKVADTFLPYLKCEDRHRSVFHAMLRNKGAQLRYLDAFRPTAFARKTWPDEVFHWFDVHWDCRGTMALGDLIYRDLTGDRSRRVPVAYMPEERVSDISTILGRPFVETWTGCRSASPIKPTRTDDKKDEHFLSFTSPVEPLPGDTRHVLLIHDSFSNGLRKVMPQVVPEFTMYNINNRDVPKLARAIKAADKVYVEIVERAAFASFARLGHPNFLGPLKKAMEDIPANGASLPVTPASSLAAGQN